MIIENQTPDTQSPSSDALNQTPEEPIIIIETDETDNQPQTIKPRKRWKYPMTLVCAVGCLALMTLSFWIWRQWSYYHRIGVPISVTPQENIQKLMPSSPSAQHPEPEVVHSSDSILGVALDLYAIKGLRATLQFEEPDTADPSVYLYSRSADHKASGEYHGSLVVQGNCRQVDRGRLGYIAMLDNQIAIGVSRSDKVREFVQKQGGSFFRQFILVSDGVLPRQFYLHGKVERRAIGRKGDTLYYIATRNKETLWAFADALREYGFVDAIYITGGTDYGYYRTRDRQRHDIGDPADYPHEKWKGIIPWLVFRAQQ